MPQLEYRKLNDEEVQASLATLEGWGLEDGQIAKVYEFKTYKDGLVFAVAAGYQADRLDHHPDLHVGYGRVKVSVNTHSVEGLSPYDFELARRLDAL
jgi:4a-hydroxytetrahydrobiopterin dehydratase